MEPWVRDVIVVFKSILAVPVNASGESRVACLVVLSESHAGLQIGKEFLKKQEMTVLSSSVVKSYSLMSQAGRQT